MDKPNQEASHYPHRRQRLHELLIVLIQRQEELELMDDEAPSLSANDRHSKDSDPARWLERNRRILKRYQALVRSAVTLDALLDSENTLAG